MIDINTIFAERAGKNQNFYKYCYTLTGKMISSIAEIDQEQKILVISTTDVF